MSVRWLVAGGGIIAFAFVLAVSGMFAGGKKKEDGIVQAPMEKVAAPSPGEENSSIGSGTAQAPSREGKIEAESHGSVPALSDEEKAYNKMVATEQREERMQKRVDYIEARIAWRRALNAAMAAARKDGNESEVERIEALEPDKKAFLQNE